MTHNETVQIELNGATFEADCEFEYDPGEPANITALPENCHPGEPAETNFIKLVLRVSETQELDISDLLEIDAFCEDIAEQIEEIAEAKR